MSSISDGARWRARAQQTAADDRLAGVAARDGDGSPLHPSRERAATQPVLVPVDAAIDSLGGRHVSDGSSRWSAAYSVCFVPLLHLYGERRLDSRSRLTFEGDGLAGGPGRAFDLSARYVRDFDERVSLFAGLRILDGGADSSSGYNFARLHYLTFGLLYRM